MINHNRHIEHIGFFYCDLCAYVVKITDYGKRHIMAQVFRS
jgi:hypothetical protein